MDGHIDPTKPHRGVPSLTWWVGEGTVGLNAPTPTVGLHRINTPSIITQYIQGVWSNDHIITYTSPTNTSGVPLGGGRGVQYRMSIDRAPIGGIHALSIATPHTRGVGGCINGSIASTTPSHSPGAITPRVPIGGGRPAPHAPGVAHPTPHVTVTSHGHSR